MTNTGVTGISLEDIPILLRGQAASLHRWIDARDLRRFAFHAVLIILGTGAFGAATGLWRAPLQAFYTAVKFPAIVLLTTLGNGLLNAMLAPLLGINLGLRQSVLAVLMSFTMAALILGAFSPLLAFVAWNVPSRAAAADPFSSHSVLLLSQVGMIATAGVAANLRLVQLLRELSGSNSSARKVLFAWLAGNLLLGSQLSWIFRPFVGSPNLPVEFLRADAFSGSFFETVFRALRYLIFS